MGEDYRFLSAPELDAMSPDERAAALNERIVTDLQSVPEEFRDRILETGERLAAERRPPHE